MGTTTRLLETARALAMERADVVVGAVETHGRYDLAGLLLGLDVLPGPPRPPGQARQLEELDLDAALARRPAVLLVDDLAHSNAPSARHEQRWQDVRELLDAGVEVHATLGVYQLESLRDVVRAITGVAVRDAVPDSFFEAADEVELVDVSPDTLLGRLREGRIAASELDPHTPERFFRRASLVALRELALRRVAEHVDAEVVAGRREEGAAVAWPTAERVLVCVGPAPESERIVRAARRIAAGLRAPWSAAWVDVSGRTPLQEADRARVEEHLQLARSLGAEVVRLSGASVAEEILAWARARNVTRIVLGKPRHPRWRDLLRGSLVDEVIRGSADIEVNVVSGESTPRPAAVREPGRAAGGLEYLRAAVTVGLAAAIASAARAVLSVPDVEMLFLLAVTVVAVTSGRGPSLLASALSVVAYDFFFVPPALTLGVADARYLLTFAMMFGVGAVISTLTLRLREQERAAVERERRTSALYAVSRQLGSAIDAAGVGEVCARAAAEVLGGPAVLLERRRDGALVPLAAAPADASLTPAEAAVARWTMEHGGIAGRGTGTWRREAVVCAPIRISAEVLGVLAVRAGGTEGLRADQREFLEALCRQGAFALERVRLADDVRQAALRARTEELRSGLLSAVSHDLRTPLAAITGAATTLRDDPNLDGATRRELLDTVCEEAERLERLVSNLLHMTRLESGAVSPRREWVPLVEVLGVALSRLERRLAGRPVRVAVPDDLPLLSVDPVLLELLLVNLLENAAKYTPAGSEIDVGAAREGGAVVVEVADRGPGIPRGEEERVFERFRRGSHPGIAGVGLGLPIARAIAQAHGGRLVASGRAGGGAVFRLTLPLGAEPPGGAPGEEAPT
ncbi:sensor histidine kinase [Anaeromyxobacter oryzae]|uniref:sensor histidine kinase n=1 Tax=Anaeromyxobacter oryzae TaxID=2918170 RepID=UPI0020BF2ADC|nr:sensor histidine kinase KdpD [Anaeromyxobacter oryzae]